MSKAKEQAHEILYVATEMGWTVQVERELLVVSKPIESTLDSFCQADSEYSEILHLLPTTRAGSQWGTDGSGVGAIHAMKTRSFVMKKSGGSKRVLSALSKLLGEIK